VDLPSTLETAALPRRLVSAVYEALMIAAILLVATFMFLGVSPDAAATRVRPVFQLYLVGLLGIYFTWFWTHGGQTAPMRAWKIRVVTADGRALTWGRAWARFFLAIPGLLAFGAGFAWALLDPDGQFLHDRLAGTRQVRENG
jgi:uncharacterized RDD family membrane protein YckC